MFGLMKKKYKFARRSFYCQGEQNTYLLKWLTHTIQTPVSKNNWILLIVTIVTTYWVKKKRVISKLRFESKSICKTIITYDLGIAEYSSLVWSIDEKNRHGVVVITLAVVGLWYWVALNVADLILLCDSLINIILCDLILISLLLPMYKNYLLLFITYNSKYSLLEIFYSMYVLYSTPCAMIDVVIIREQNSWLKKIWKIPAAHAHHLTLVCISISCGRRTILHSYRIS